MCACLPQHPWLFIFSSRCHDQQSSDQNFSSRGHLVKECSENYATEFVDWRTDEMCSKYVRGFKVILHQFWVKKIFPWKFNLEYSGTFTKLFMHISSRNMFPTTRNLQIRVHVYRSRHYSHCQECVHAYLSIHDCLSFLHKVMISNHRTKTFLHEVMIGNHRNKTTES
jgi:hypothetical protein